MKLTAGFTDYENCPEGAHVGVCYGVVDMGTQEGKFGAKRELRIYWEVHCDEKMSDGRPFSVNERYNMTLHEGSNLRRDLESWRGKPFEETESFELERLIGVPCLLNIVHTVKGDHTYADVKSIMPLPKAMPKPQMINDRLFVSLDASEFDADAFARLTERMQEVLRKSPEFAALQTGGKSHADGVSAEDTNEVPF